MIKIGFEYKGQECNSWLQLYGEYASLELERAILGAGWRRPEHPASRLPNPEKWMRTDEFLQPPGVGMFGGSTKEEWSRNREALMEALAPMKFDKPRKVRLEEML